MIGGSVTSDGLIFHFDSANPKSYPGEATTNLISQINAYPSVGNGWGTYNVNQYNSNQYFSIGTVSNVTDNVVTMQAAHPLRTYDVVRPQTTGGGLTAGVDYYIKKVSTTQFSVHQYLATQNGSLGFTCLANIHSNTKIAINATSFPTMWWGAPHQPNSGIIKTITPNGFDFEGRKHDCLRHHSYRPDSVVDGMAYGVTPTIGAGVTHTISCMMRAVSSNSVYIAWQAYWAGSTPQSANLFAGNVTREWTKYTYTKTTIAGATYVILYWLYQTAKSAIDISEIQVELNKDHATLFTVGTRDGNGVDLVGNQVVTIHGTCIHTDYKSINLGSTGNITNYITIPSTILNGLTEWTIQIWLYINTRNSGVDTFLTCGSGNDFTWYFTGTSLELDNAAGTTISYSPPTTTWFLFTATGKSGTVYVYKNDTYLGTMTNTTTITVNSQLGIVLGQEMDSQDGTFDSTQCFLGRYGQINFYNRLLPTTEIIQNYRAQKGRFGL